MAIEKSDLFNENIFQEVESFLFETQQKNYRENNLIIKQSVAIFSSLFLFCSSVNNHAIVN